MWHICSLCGICIPYSICSCRKWMVGAAVLQKPRDYHKIDVMSCNSLTTKKISWEYWMFYSDKTIYILSSQWTTSAPCVLSETLLKIIPLKLFQLLKQRVFFSQELSGRPGTSPLQWYAGSWLSHILVSILLKYFPKLRVNIFGQIEKNCYHWK